MSAVRRADGMAQVVGERIDRGGGGLCAVRAAPAGRWMAWLMRLMTSAPHATCGFSMPRLASARAALQIDQEAGDIGGAEVDRQAERAAAGRRKADQLRRSRMCARSDQSPPRSAAGNCRAAARSTAGSGSRQRADHAVEVRQSVGQRRFRQR